MKLRVLITGSTGMVGKGVLLECLDDARVESVLVINRQSIGMQHPKLSEVIHADFMNLAPIEGWLAGHNACFFCLGVSSAGMSEEKYTRLTYDLTLNFARTLVKHSPDLVFIYVSGKSTDSSEKGRIMWARVKGRTENALLALPFKAAYMFRPGGIQPMRGVRPKVPVYNFLYILMSPLFIILRHFPDVFTTSVKLGRAMIQAASAGFPKKFVESADINRLGGAQS